MSDTELFTSPAPAQASGGEARQSPRITVAWRARVMHQPPHFVEGRALNVSEQGVGLLLDVAFPVGQRLTTALAVPDPADRSQIKPVMLQLKVIFNVASGDMFKIGTQIVQIDDAGRQLLRHWISKG